MTKFKKWKTLIVAKDWGGGVVIKRQLRNPCAVGTDILTGSRYMNLYR